MKRGTWEAVPAGMSESVAAELASIERSANEMLEKLAQEKATLPQRINAEITQKTAAIAEERKKELQALKEAAAAAADERIEQINKEAQERRQEVESAFTNQREQWRAELFNRMVNGL